MNLKYPILTSTIKSETFDCNLNIWGSKMVINEQPKNANMHFETSCDNCAYSEKYSSKTSNFDVRFDDMPKRPSPILLRVEEVAHLLSIGRTKTYGLMNSGQLPFVVIGGVRRITYWSVEDYVRTLSKTGGAN